ncbi:hypothetical protein NUU61_004016 [Penicillium alfredii]|uniref:Alcohol dehydrogenase-like C-terminal domain-containing protein n=1 Tax=Penicillium alfredii TaxID=1506179 RepID=A0A9W9FKI2_9EURO|nr:uncharacterized protein NUU61_004016 [Penicillium alfredii]KAJ5101794.1 hypothetical protein NUU61_004016 [Penicillium alfredii]
MHPSGYIVKKTKLSDRCQKECLLRLHPRFPQISARLSFPCQKICPENFVPRDEQIPILIWGAGSSVGHFAVQILKNWGYKNVIVAASLKHEKKLKCYGAAYVFDYRSTGVVDCILELLTSSKSPEAIRVFDCVDSKFGSLLPISKIATRAGSKVAVVLPVVINSSSDANGLQLSAHVSTGADWAKVVEIHSIVSYGYEARVVQGDTLLERACTALDITRTGTVSGERLVWKVWTAEEFPEYK